ncbi:hypothetical protein CHS0354_034476 [Potamilus streckersoni]|uniref:DUF4772 domain-containing protein n=1 Tax=Potamilus streckersoni TaxID=2493646 RepID=A0AAE0T1Y9_9BIVA|nr:hypothetical protein CHS0354_034476 [Potamilus streckersoni]
MFGNRRLAKRSIVGTKIAALRQDGRFYPGVIRSQYAEEGPFTGAVYTVVFEDGFEKNVQARDIIGQGFQTISAVALKNGQKVYVTLNGREVSGTVIDHDRTMDEALINVRFHTGEEMEISKKLDDVRLLQSRKSARLVDQDTDYSKLADLQLSEPKREGSISREIDVPVTPGIVVSKADNKIVTNIHIVNTN